MADRRFVISDTPLDGLRLVRRLPLADERGFLARLYCDSELATAGLSEPICQINHTLTRALAAVRGMHFQHPPFAEDKFVSCVRGEVYDVAVDVRWGSPTFLRWHAEILSAANGLSLFIPKGFAHGFQTLTADCELLYLHTARYHRDAEGALNALDPALKIDWPLSISEMSARDRSHPFIDEKFTGINL